jgi:hypothetical protein
LTLQHFFNHHWAISFQGTCTQAVACQILRCT